MAPSESESVSRSGSDVSLAAAPTAASDEPPLEQVPADIAEMILAIEAQEEAEETEAAQAAASSSSRSRNRRIDFTAEADAACSERVRA